ncbi:DEAD/DEAH box helicase [Microbacterium elymi]|uniref:DEAD/DEAH box helicase n=1 Tax=Microbacterium elymi TaxID=2909587 RepID=A0ABY5NN65_9MICO|nr:DEAD/DEAH box helicase [Microbacterium elymi]UUT36651.1 DEAD/DEAH box helicase [Microbacterium elymi]
MPLSTFLSLGVPENLAAVLSAQGKTEAFPIQRDTLPDALAGRDVLGRGRTGSGKTIAFALPLVARLSAARVSRRPGHPRGLVLAPTRELATQIAATVTPLADAAGLTVTTIFGGVSQRPQEQAMARGVDIVVACPGRLEDLMKQGVVSLDAIEITVLDEADHMADMGFLPGVTRIMKATPVRGQRMLFSATLDRGVDTLVQRFLHDPVRHEVDESSVPAGVMTHRVFVVPDADAKKDLVQHLARGRARRILFTRTKHQAKKLAKQLTAAGIPAVDLQGNLSQPARERNLAAFNADPAAGGVRVLVATDVAARGVHVDDVELVVHVDPPVEHKSYLHRSGRTARAGAEGVVVTVVLAEQRRDVTDLLRKAQIRVGLESVDPNGTQVTDLVGDPAPYVKPAAMRARAAQRPAKASSNRGSNGSARGGSARNGSRGGANGDRPAEAPARSGSRRRRGNGGQGGSADAAARTPRTDAGAARAKGGKAPHAQSSHAQSSHAPAPQSGRTASGKPTMGATVGGMRSGGSRRASRPGGR